MAADKNSGKIIYQNDGVQISETPKVRGAKRITPASSQEQSLRRNIDIGMSNVIGTLISYTRFRFDKGGEGAGECLICGRETSCPTRKICTKCLEKYSEQIQDEAVSIAYDNVKISLSVDN